MRSTLLLLDKQSSRWQAWILKNFLTHLISAFIMHSTSEGKENGNEQNFGWGEVQHGGGD